MKTLWHILRTFVPLRNNPWLGLIALAMLSGCAHEAVKPAVQSKNRALSSISPPTNPVPCTNCPPSYTVNPLTNDPMLHFDTARRIQHYGSTYTLNGWQWDFALNTNQLSVYNTDGNVAAQLTEPNGSANMGIRDAWTIQSHASNQIVGVIDSGAHGQFVSSCVGQPGGDGSNTVGVARQVTILQRTKGTDTVVSNRIHELVVEGAKVINLSLGWDGRTYPGKTIDAMRDNPDVIFTVAGANSNVNIDDPLVYDSLCQCQLPNVICVASSTKADERTNPAIWGTNVFGYAPGRRVLVETYPWTPGDAFTASKFKDDGLEAELREVYYSSGSSLSTPKVAGIVALLKEHYPDESVAQIIERLAAGCEQPSGLAGLSRFGRFNAYRSLVWTRVPKMSIDSQFVYAAAGAGQSIVVESCADLSGWTVITNLVGTGWPVVVASVTSSGTVFYRAKL